MSHGIIQNPEGQLAYVLGGRGKFTLVSKATGNRFTYKSVRKDKGVFVFTLVGPDNEADFDLFAGTLFYDTTTFRRASDAESARAFLWWAEAQRNRRYEALTQVEFWHEGKCGRCGRALTDPESIARGLGPVCAERG